MFLLEVMSMLHKIYILLFLGMISSSCALFKVKRTELQAHPNNTEIRQNLPTFFKVDIPVEGYIGISQKFKSYGFCQALRPEIKVIINPYRKQNELELTSFCEKKSKTLRVSSKNILPAGSYRIYLKFEHDSKSMLGHPNLDVLYKNPDFASDDDHLQEGAKAWAPNQKLQEVVDPSKGDTNDWFKLNSGDNSVRLTLLDKSKGNVMALLKWISVDTGKIIKSRKLTTGKREVVHSKDNEELYLHVFGKRYTPESKYTVFRKDIAKETVLPLNLIDVYPISKSDWSVMIKVAEGIQIGASVRIRARTTSGKNVVLGRCSINSISGEVATCTLKYSTSQAYSQYFAELVKKTE